jgi:dCMP deaminase
VSARRRPTKDEYLMHIAVVASSRGTCDRRRVGCVLAASDGRVLSTGYNGSAPGAPHCDDVGHMMHDGHCVRTIHAEENAIAHAARAGIALAGATAYCTTHPCPGCLLLLRAAGVTRVVFLGAYHAEEDAVSAKLLDEMNGGPAAVRIHPFRMSVERYDGERRWPG